MSVSIASLGKRTQELKHLVFIYMTLLVVFWLPMASALDLSIEQGNESLEVKQDDGQWIKPDSNKLSLPVTVRTQSSGKAEISQGDTKITLNPNTELTLAATSSRAAKLLGLVKQRVGSAIYKVEKHPGDFVVETPYLVSVVKGTRFSVVTNSADSFITVTEGLVEVRDVRSGDINMARPGDILRSSQRSDKRATSSAATTKAINKSQQDKASINPDNNRVKAQGSLTALKVSSEKTGSLKDTATNNKPGANKLVSISESRERKVDKSRPSLKDRETSKSDIQLNANVRSTINEKAISLIENNDQLSLDLLKAAEERGIDLSMQDDIVDIVDKGCNFAASTGEAVAGCE